MALFSLNRRDPVQGLLSLQSELDRLFRNPRGLDLGLSGCGVFPSINVFSDRDGIVVRTEVPGVDPSAIAISIEDHTLTISGERSADTRAQGSFHRRERSHGKFSRSLQLPRDLDPEKATADCHHGLLSVHIPKCAEAQPRQVKITAA